MEIRKGRYISAIIAAPFRKLVTAEGEGDLLITVYRDEEETAFSVEARFRFYRDDKVFDSDDRKRFYRLKVNEPEEVTVDAMIGLALSVVEDPNDVLWIRPKSDDPDVTLDMLDEIPMFHKKEFKQ